MKVFLLNGSPHEYGCTRTALGLCAEELEKSGIETEIYWLGTEPIGGCTACGACRKTGGCVNEKVREFTEKARQADGFLFGSPVHYAGLSGSVTAFLDRVFFSAGPDVFRLKPGSAVLSARRGGTTAAYDQMNKYFGISQMPIVSSRYWNMVHGSKPEDVLKDEEGCQIMRMLGRNMAYFLHCREAADKAGILPPENEKGVMTNFIR